MYQRKRKVENVKLNVRVAIATGCHLWMMTVPLGNKKNTRISLLFLIFLLKTATVYICHFMDGKLSCHGAHWCRNTLSFVKWIKRQHWKWSEEEKKCWTNFWCACIGCYFTLDLKWIFIMRPTVVCVRVCECWRAMCTFHVCMCEIIYAKSREREAIKCAHLNIISLLFVFYFSICESTSNAQQWIWIINIVHSQRIRTQCWVTVTIHHFFFSFSFTSIRNFSFSSKSHDSVFPSRVQPNNVWCKWMR